MGFSGEKKVFPSTLFQSLVLRVFVITGVWPAALSASCRLSHVAYTWY